MSGPLWMPAELEETSRNHRPLSTHDRGCTAEDHRDHKAAGAQCVECGCCWGCDSDCCAEYICPNKDCGCSDKPEWTPPALSALSDRPAPTEGGERRG